MHAHSQLQWSTRGGGRRLPIPISRVIRRMSADVHDARLGRRLSWRLWPTNPDPLAKNGPISQHARLAKDACRKLRVPRSEYIHVREIFADAKATTAGEDKNPTCKEPDSTTSGGRSNLHSSGAYDGGGEKCFAVCPG